MAYFLALCSAFTAALGAAYQDREMKAFSEEQAKGIRLFLTSISKPMWWFGLLVMTGSPIFQYLALRVGNLTQVQPMLTTELLFILVIIVITHHERPGRTEWVGAVGIVLGLAVFLFAAQPSGDISTISAKWAIILTVGALALVGGIWFFSRSTQGSLTAALLGAAAATCFAYQAVMTQIVAGVSILRIFGQPALYALAIGGTAGFLFFEKALRAGHIAASRAAMVIVDPFLSVLIGVCVFHDHLNHTPGAIIAEVVGLTMLFAGAKVLATSPLIGKVGPASPAPEKGGVVA